MEELRAALQTRRQQGLYRKRLITQSPQGVKPVVNGRQLLSFCSNDYLGLANHPAVKQAFIEAVQLYGVGSGSAHLVNGHSQLHHDCELALAEFTGRDRALLFSTGYMANLAITSALIGRNDYIFQDKLNHASLIDAAQLTAARLLRYPHRNLERLQDALLDTAGHHAHGRRLIMTDAVFSMDGDKADVSALADIARQTQSWLMIDDAHGFGVLGESGAGLCEELKLTQHDVPILMATLGKAVGVSGAFIAGSEALIETLIQQARSYIFTTASPPANAAAVMQSIKIIREEKWRRDKLQDLIGYFRQQMTANGFSLMLSDTAIQPLLIGDNHRALAISDKLIEQGILVTAIRPPTVPKGTSRLRFTLSAEHEEEHIDLLVRVLQVVMELIDKE